ncbi:MAG: tRNA 2-thiouridine(34) synthase MnmA [Candidatus Omnitrophica bacterium]|nr:tRNA 2-thiouridine(34) synthase MnmA [Candidatus Omnitrophota bacterium]
MVFAKIKAVVAMSGGVDSSVAAALLKEKGFEVIGITMCFNIPDIITRKPRCCGLQGIEDARRVAHKLGIRHYVVNMKKALEDKVIKDFCREYLLGKTPNPCIRCNQFIKFQALLNKAKSLGASYLATGHYAKIENGMLKKARDLKKDQSYFLYRLGRNQLKRLLFPLGGYTKDEIRGLARGFGLSVADKTESQEICFLPEDNYRQFLKSRFPGMIRPGEVVDAEGRVLGKHKGIALYTIGQREGLGIATGFPIYVIRIEPRANRVVVGKKNEVLKKEFIVGNLHFIGKPIKKKIEVNVKIRYNHKETRGALFPQANTVKVRFNSPQFAITPGQSAVFYEKDTVLGGGIITKVFN